MNNKIFFLFIRLYIYILLKKIHLNCRKLYKLNLYSYYKKLYI